MIDDSLREQYFDQGYIILRGIVPPDLIERMRTAVDETIQSAIDTGVPTVFWEDRSRAVPSRIGHILREDRVRPEFVAQFEETPLVEVVESILQMPVRFALCGVLCGGGGHPYIQGWHRDSGETQNEEDLARDLENMKRSVQMNAPLYPDRYLQIVPGSHKRLSLPEEKAVFENDPTGDIPGGMTVEMEPGDAAFYFPQMIHRGFNPDGHRRFSMHHAFWAAGEPVHRHEVETITRILDVYGPVTRTLAQRYLDALPQGTPPDIIRRP